jgi:membrane protease YdiL (CAAX protease family)
MSNASSEPPSTLAMPKLAAHATNKKVPWNPILGVIFIAVVFFGAQLFSGIVLSLYPLLRHWTSAQATAWLSNSVAVQFIYILLAETLTVGFIYLFLRFYKQGLNYIGLKKPRFRDPLYGLLAIPVYYILFGVLVYVVSQFFPSLNVSQKQELGFDNVAGQSQLIYTFLSLVILPPLAEEILFRGFLYKTLRSGLGIPAAALITSLLFGAGHLAEGGASGPLYVGALQTFVLSLVLVYLRQKTHSLWAGITLHASNNFIAFLYLFVLHSH